MKSGARPDKLLPLNPLSLNGKKWTQYLLKRGSALPKKKENKPCSPPSTKTERKQTWSVNTSARKLQFFQPSKKIKLQFFPVVLLKVGLSFDLTSFPNEACGEVATETRLQPFSSVAGTVPLPFTSCYFNGLYLCWDCDLWPLPSPHGSYFYLSGLVIFLDSGARSCSSPACQLPVPLLSSIEAWDHVDALRDLTSQALYSLS